jgi:predicted nicotinamide N-methyase
MITDWEFDVRNHTVLELGAGAGLPGIISALSEAAEVRMGKPLEHLAMTSSQLISSMLTVSLRRQVTLSDYPAPEILRNIRHNLDANLSPELLKRVSVAGHVWGDLSDDLCSTHPGTFSRVIAADCFWMDKQHDNLSRSIVHLMARDGILLAIAGFHTGRAKVAAFFESVERAGLELLGPIMEKDIVGNHRSWERDRGIEDPVDRKRWLVIGLFRHKNS